METIALFYLAKPKYGGWVTYTSHLFRSFKNNNQPVYLFKISNKTEKNLRHYADDVHYQNVDINTALGLAEQFKTIITAVDKDYLSYADMLLQKNSNIIVHDPTEMKEDLIKTIKNNNITPITIRKINVNNLKNEGINSIFIKHPYLRFNTNVPEKTQSAVATSRIDFDKHTEIIVEANLKLKEKIKIYGAENRLFTFHKLNKLDEKWRDNYYGKFSNKLGDVQNILNPHRFMVDMSAIKKDGGGSQYTFLEAWDSGCVPVLNKKWDTNGTMQDYKNCIFVENSKDLVNILTNNKQYLNIVNNGITELEKHNGSMIAKEYLSILK